MGFTDDGANNDVNIARHRESVIILSVYVLGAWGFAVCRLYLEVHRFTWLLFFRTVT